MNITPKNEKLDLGTLQHLEQLLGLGWVIVSIPPPKHVTLLGLGLSTFRVRVRLHGGDEFSVAFKVNYISEDLLPVTVTPRLLLHLAYIALNGSFHTQRLQISETSMKIITNANANTEWEWPPTLMLHTLRHFPRIFFEN